MNKDRDIEETDPKTDPPLWKAATRDVKKLLPGDAAISKDKPARAHKIPPIDKTVDKKVDKTVDKAGEKPVVKTGKTPPLPVSPPDRQLENRLRKGEMKIDAVFDLHGNTASEARRKLLQFLRQAIATNKRCVLVITGKGLSRSELNNWFGEGKGVIKREFRLWLEDASVAPYINSVSEAQPKHGGSGAYYILLRKTNPK